MSHEKIHPPWICCTYRGLLILSPKMYAGPGPRLRPNLTYFPTTMRIEGSMHGSDHALSLN